MTADIERGRSNGSRPFGSAAPVRTSSSAAALAPQFSVTPAAASMMGSTIAGRSVRMSTIVGTAAAISFTWSMISAG